MTIPSDPIELFYDRNPYPRPEELAWIPRKDFACDLAYRTGLRGLLRSPIRVWAPGCGTLLPVYLLLELPNAEIVATDISQTALDYATLALETSGLDTSRLQLRKERIEDADWDRAFDYIVASGVLHHLQDPKCGLHQLHGALKDQGVVELMLYNRAHRQQYLELRRALKLLLPTCPACSQDEFRAAVHALRETSSRSPGIRYYLEEAAHLVDQDYTTFLDAYVNPRETSFDIHGLMLFLKEGGFQFHDWLRPASWDLSARLPASQVRETYLALSEIDRSVVTSIIDGDFSPYLSFYARKIGAESVYRREPRSFGTWTVRLPASMYRVSFAKAGCEVRETPFDVRLYPPEVRDDLRAFSTESPIAEVLADGDRRRSMERLLDLVRCPLEIVPPADRPPQGSQPPISVSGCGSQGT